jgi:hypothetical protein
LGCLILGANVRAAKCLIGPEALGVGLVSLAVLVDVDVEALPGSDSERQVSHLSSRIKLTFYWTRLDGLLAAIGLFWTFWIPDGELDATV